MTKIQTISFPDDLYHALKKRSEATLGGGNFSRLVVDLVMIGLRATKEKSSDDKNSPENAA